MSECSPFLLLRIFPLKSQAIGRSGWTLAPIALVARGNFSRQYAELVDGPIANKLLNRRQYLLIACVSLGVASSLLRSQMFEFEHGGWCISIVSHDRSPSQYRLPISTSNMAVSGRPLGAILAAYLFVSLLWRTHMRTALRPNL